MSFWDEIKYRAKKGALAVWGPADLHEDEDPTKNLEREHDENRSANPRSKDWDQG